MSNPLRLYGKESQRLALTKNNIKRYKFWFYYLVITIGIMGILLSYIMVLPVAFLSLFFPSLWYVASFTNQWGNKALFLVQPWFSGECKIKLPDKIQRREEGCLIVANHRSHLDVFLMLQSVPYLRILAKRQLFFVPFLGIMLWALRMIPVKRGDINSYAKAMTQIKDAIGQGHRVLVFPEMTRCEEGALDLGRFQLLPFKIAMENNTPIVPIVFWKTDYFWPKGKNAIAFGGKAYCRSLKTLYPKDFNSAQELANAAKNRIQDAQTELKNMDPFAYDHTQPLLHPSL